MNLFRTLGVAGALALSGAGLGSCLSPPDFSTKPEIEFQEIRKRYGAGYDSLTFVINFKDGDGDLGLTPQDLLNDPYLPAMPPARNDRSFNYFIQPERKIRASADQFETYIPPGSLEGSYDSYFLPPYPQSLEKAAPIKGVLRYKLDLYGDGEDPSQLSPGDVVRFKISIMDRAGNMSNEITTTTITIGPN